MSELSRMIMSNINDEVLPNPFLLRMAMLLGVELQFAGVQGTMGSQIASSVPLWVVGYIQWTRRHTTVVIFKFLNFIKKIVRSVFSMSWFKNDSIIYIFWISASENENYRSISLRPMKLEGPEAFRPKINCPETDVFLFFWEVMGVERWGMHLVWVKSVFWFDFYVIFTWFFL